VNRLVRKSDSVHELSLSHESMEIQYPVQVLLAAYSYCMHAGQFELHEGGTLPEPTGSGAWGQRCTFDGVQIVKTLIQKKNMRAF
jgi:hypothetical protein